jgi:lysophospholipase L1-like esterase
MLRQLLHLLLYLLGLFGTAQLISGFGFGFTQYKQGAFYTPDGIEVPLAEIANFLMGGGYLGGDEGPHPRGSLTPGLRVKQGYDRPRWDYFDAQGCLLVEHNSIGFRDVEFPVQKPPGEFRVLAVGDSFTYGSGVLAEDTWPEVLERGLASDGRKVQVVNCGFAAGSYEPAGYEKWMVTDGLLLEPDLVIVGFCLNDMGNGNDVPMLSYQGVTTVGCPVALLDQFLTYYENRRLMAEAPDYAQVVQQHPETWRRTQQALLELQRILREAGVPLVIAVIPMMSQLASDPSPYDGLHRMIGAFCAEHGMPCVDLQREFTGKSDLDIWVHPTDQHPNHLGQRLLGEGVRRFLRAHRLDGRR